MSLKKLQVSKRSGGRNVARRRSSPRKRAGSIDESFRLPAHSFHSCTLIHGLGVFKVSTGLRVASTRISLKEEATERCPAPPDPACRRRAAAVAVADAASRRRVGGAGAAVAAADGGVSPPCVCCEPPTIRAPVCKQTQRWCVYGTAARLYLSTPNAMLGAATSEPGCSRVRCSTT